MRGLDDFEEDGTGTVFRDVITLALLGFVATVILLLPHVRPEAKTSEAVDMPGNVMVEVRWPDQVDADVDLWVQAPTDVPVGYSNKGGRVFNLLRDDLGTKGDATGLNYEVSYSRGVIAGEYTVNVHLYRNNTRLTAIPVTAVISVKGPTAHTAKQILTSSVDLRHIGQELTVFRFRLTENGELEPGSVHALPKPLRSVRR
ncbi:MAG TPA: hypothetical protein VF274_07445 [Alphaproteobacteria bacterium]|jgi:hypothetical protein